MCGLAGIAEAHQTELVKRMLSTITHRGPDGDGLHQSAGHTLGHVRLSIIDLEGGVQPMADPESDSWIVFNGEIYNHQKLRRRLGKRRFRTNSDTEVILQLHREEAGRQAEQLDGMFAFAIANDDLTLARDPLGIKPLYLGRHQGKLVFASEIKAVLAVSEVIAEFPPGYSYSEKTGWRRYYQLSAGPAEVTDADAAAQGIRIRLEEAVRKRLLADVPVGVFLSGGLDSSLIAAFARRHKDPLDSFFVGTEDSPDRAYAEAAAAFLGTKHHTRSYSIAEAIEALPAVIYHLESFDCALVRSALPNYFLAELAAERVKVALSGEGADELFAGYEYLKALPKARLQEELVGITEALHNTNLQRCDRMSMAHGLEVRVPFLDLALVEYAFRISADLKLPPTNTTEKWILRKAAQDALPESIVWRKKAKFAAGSGLGDHLLRFAEEQISDADFVRDREIADGVELRSKEELLYYRIFRQLFPAEKLLPLIGRSRSI